MTQRTDIPYPVVSSGGIPSHVLVPIEVWDALTAKQSVAEGQTFVPMDVAEAVTAGDTPLKAWRQHKRLTQEALAKRMGVSRCSYAQMEKSERPQKATLDKAAAALGIEVAQVADLYYA